jgi:hypothetical protein
VNTRILKLRRLRIAGLVAGSVALVGAAAIVTASAAGLNLGFRPAASTQPATADTAALVDKANGPSAVCSDFISHLSSDLGKSQSQLDSAIQKAIGETLADQVKNGKLTQAQAAAIKKKLAGHQLCSVAGPLGKKPGAPGTAPVGASLQQLETAAASALGITSAQLKLDLAGGMTLSQIAAAQNPPVTENTFRSRLIAQLKPRLDTAVTNKKLTQAQEDHILKQLQNGPIPFWSTPIGKRPASAPTATPSQTA